MGVAMGANASAAAMAQPVASARAGRDGSTVVASVYGSTGDFDDDVPGPCRAGDVIERSAVVGQPSRGRSCSVSSFMRLRFAPRSLPAYVGVE